LPPVDEHQANLNDRKRPMPSEDEWRMYARDLQDTKEDLYFIDSLVHRGISKVSIYNSNLSILFYFIFLK